jgi:hypothetical protein
MKIKILFENIDFPVKIDEDISFGKGYKSAIVNIEKFYYEVTFYDIIRINQHLESEKYYANSGLIIVNGLSYKSIRDTIVELANLNYFALRMLSIEKHEIVQFENYKELKFQ